MNGRQELRRVISLFDMTKVDLPSFNLSMTKFDEVAHAYSKILLLASIIALEQSDESEESKKQCRIAVQTISKLVENPKAYCYDACSKSEREVVNKAAESAWGYMPPSKKINQIKEKSKNQLMVKNLKHIMSMLQYADENYPDVLLDKYMDDDVFLSTLERFRQQEHASIVNEKQSEHCNVTEPEVVNEVSDKTPPKKSIWQKIISIFKK